MIPVKDYGLLLGGCSARIQDLLDSESGGGPRVEMPFSIQGRQKSVSDTRTGPQSQPQTR